MAPNDESSAQGGKTLHSNFWNWLSLTGAVIALGSFFAFWLLFAMDTFSSQPHAYLGILTFIVAPAFLILGLVLMGVGWYLYRRHKAKYGDVDSPMSFAIDLSRPRDRRNLVVFIALSLGFLMVTAFGSYHTYHFTESVEFCGTVCHEVMEPEYVTYIDSPHARVSCVACHIGSGADWFVRSKISGLYQVYATLADEFPRPIPTPVENLRPAQDTCMECHWPQKFTGDMVRTYHHYLSDEENTPYSLRLILKVGGGDPTQGPVGGIHWHTDQSVLIEYIATDEDRMTIPWVRMTDAEGKTTVFQSEELEGDLEDYEIRKMDCIDCHNRPAHIIKPPNAIVDEALFLGMLDPDMPYIKERAVELMVGDYADDPEAMAAIETGLREEYGDHPQLEETIEAVQALFHQHFFPTMNARWDVYPNHLGHKNWPGCFRCHGGEHVAVGSENVLGANSCDDCHSILAQGSGEELTRLAPEGFEFEHPEGPTYGLLCSDCHTGGPQ